MWASLFHLSTAGGIFALQVLFMECESCGKKMESYEAYLVLIEGARLSVCPSCSRLGKVLQSPNSPKRQAPISYSAKPQSLSSLKSGFELVENYGQKMRQARNGLQLPLNVLAEKIAEKESFLERIENEKTLPSENLARKIEKELGIKLLEETSVQSQSDSDLPKKYLASKGLTLGDILEIEKKKKR